MMSIHLDNEIKIAKKLSVEENLSNLRKLLGEKIPKNSVFTLNDGTQIDFNDEAETKISDIIDNKKILMKIVKDPNQIPIEIYINEEFKYKKELSKKDELRKIRKLLSDIMNNETNFSTEDGSKIDKNDEDEIILENILEGNKLKINLLNSISKQIKKDNEYDETSSDSDNIKEEKLLIEFYLNEKPIYNKKCLNTEKLCNVRKLLSFKIIENFFYFKRG